MDNVSTIVPLSLMISIDGSKPIKFLYVDPLISQLLGASDTRRHLNVATVSIGYIKVVFIGYSANAIASDRIINQGYFTTVNR